MTDHDAILAACWDHHDDVTPFLVLADHLDETADYYPDPDSQRDRASLIRAECELERLEPRKRLSTERAGMTGGGGALNPSRGGPDYYEFSMLRDEHLAPGDRVDFPQYRGNGKGAKWIHGLRVVRVNPEDWTLGRIVVVCRDKLSVPWPGRKLSARIAALKSRHLGPKATGARWDRERCPKCGGGNARFDACTCGGSADLFIRNFLPGVGFFRESSEPHRFDRPVHVHRGLLLVGATLEECVEEERCPRCRGSCAEPGYGEIRCSRCSGTGRIQRPTPWAKALLTARPDCEVMLEGAFTRRMKVFPSPDAARLALALALSRRLRGEMVQTTEVRT